MKPYRVSSTCINNLLPYNSPAWPSAHIKVSRKDGYHHQSRSASGTAVSEGLKRATASALSPRSACFYTSLGAFPTIKARCISNQAKSSTFSPSPPSTTIITASKGQAEKFNPRINPLSITLPPPFQLPERKPNQRNISYLYAQGRAYLKFFKTGLLNIWTMRKIAQDLEKKEKENNPQLLSLPQITRAEFQLLLRNEAALSKVVPFGIFIFIFAEMSPILLLFITSIVPEPCQLPSVQKKLEEKFNQRKFKGFIRYKEYIETTEKGKDDKQLLEAGSAGAGADSSSSLTSSPQSQDSKLSPTNSLLTSLSTPSLRYASIAIKAHPAILDRLSSIPLLSYVSSLFMTRDYLINRIRERLKYLRADDALLLRDGSIEELSPEELKRAVAERGYLADSSLGVSDGIRVKEMKEWLGRSGASKDGKCGKNGENELLRLVLGS